MSASQKGELVLDQQTLKDLEIFASESDSDSLFEFCNLTHTEGGAKVLRRRMEHPMSDVDAIKATQQAISFVMQQREVFDDLHTITHTANRVESYVHEILPVLTQENAIEFGFNAISMWANHDRHYLSITLGVQFASRLIRTLRTFVHQPVLLTADGDLAPLLEEMRNLVGLPGLLRVPDEELTGKWPWKTLRLDQVFRLYERSTMRRLLELLYEIDALVAMADVTRDHGFTLPVVEQGPLGVEARGLAHPFVQHAIANSLDLDQQRRVLFLTGPNMAGKTTYLRAVATSLYLAHLGMGVPAGAYRFSPADRLFSSISLSDDLRGGVSYFRAEALRVKAVAEAMAEGHRVVAVMDEPFKGTNVKDAMDASLAILERFAARENCLTLFSSHLIELNEQMQDNRQLDCRHFGADESEEKLRFDYILRKGVSSQRLGMRVLAEEGIFALLDRDEETDADAT